MSKSRPTIAIVGAGRMGTGIAIAFAYAGFPVELIDCKQRPAEEAKRVLDRAATQINESLNFVCTALKADKPNDILSRVSYHDLGQAEMILSTADVVFEAVPEVMQVKEDTFRLISSFLSSKALVASTTSSFLVDTLAEFVTTPGRFMNTHWLNPAYLIPIVEVSYGHATQIEAVDMMIKLLEDAGKVPVRCAASPGFIVPRIQALAMNEAARLVEEGVASAEDIDKASRLGFGLRFTVLGLLEFIDWGGGDILYYASDYLRQALNDERFCSPDIIKNNMADGKIGLKSGQGFYDFTHVDKLEYQLETVKKFIELLQHLNLLRPPA